MAAHLHVLLQSREPEQFREASERAEKTLVEMTELLQLLEECLGSPESETSAEELSQRKHTVGRFLSLTNKAKEELVHAKVVETLSGECLSETRIG